MMKNSKLKFSEYMQNISRSKSFSKFVLIVYNDVSTSSLLLQAKHPHVLYEYKDNTPQGCAVTDNYSGGYERGKRSPSSLANLLPFTGV